MAASAPITGVEGAVALTTNFATWAIDVYEWTGTYDSDMYPVEVFGDTTKGHKDYRGMYRLSGSIKGLIPAVTFPIANLAPGTAAAQIVLTERSGKTHTFSGHLNNIQIGPINRRTGLNEYSANFISDGEVTPA